MTETEGANFGMGMINLTPWSERDQTAAELIEIYKDRTSHIKDADISSSCLLQFRDSVMPAASNFVYKIKQQAALQNLPMLPIH